MPPMGEDGGRAMFAWLREMRDRWPVWKDPVGFWSVFRYADVESAASDPDVFSSDTSAAIPGMERLQRGTLTRMDPPGAPPATPLDQPVVHPEAGRRSGAADRRDRHYIAGSGIRLRPAGSGEPVRLPAARDRDRGAARGADRRPGAVSPLGGLPAVGPAHRLQVGGLHAHRRG